MKLKILQWNIGGGYVDSGTGKYDELNIDYIKKVIQKHSPDICFLQEIHSDTTYSQAKEIASLGYYFVFDTYAESHIEKGKKLGQAILSKTPLLKHSFHLFHNPRWESVTSSGEHYISHDKGITSCEVLIAGKEVKLQTLHLVPFRIFGKKPLNKDSLKVRESVEELIGSEDELLLLGGDFNYAKEPGGLEEFIPSVFKNNCLESALEKPTTPTGGYYDRFLYKGFTIENISIIDSATTDHYPVLGEFYLN